MSEIEPLTWEATYAVVDALQRYHPLQSLEDVSLGLIYQWVLALPDFDDDPALANDEILMDIYREWLDRLMGS